MCRYVQVADQSGVSLQAHAVRVARKPGGSRHYHQNFAGGDGCFGLRSNFRYQTGLRGLHFILHLHGFDYNESLTLFHYVAD